MSKGRDISGTRTTREADLASPFLGDTYVEATITAETEHAFTFKVHFKVTHFGTDQHANALQEFPAVYANLAYSRFARYGGTRPWTNDTVSFYDHASTAQRESTPVRPRGVGGVRRQQ